MFAAVSQDFRFDTVVFLDIGKMDFGDNDSFGRLFNKGTFNKFSQRFENEEKVFQKSLGIAFF